MKMPDVVGTMLGLSLIGMDAAASDTPVVPIPEPHSTGNPWADVALFALRVVGLLGVTVTPTLLSKYLDRRNGKRGNK